MTPTPRALLLLLGLLLGASALAAEDKTDPKSSAELQRLYTAVPAWLGRDLADEALTLNRAYADLTFAFAFARLKDTDRARKLLAQAADVLKTRDDAHRGLLRAYTFRIDQALAGRPHAGALPKEQFDELAKTDRMPRYIVDRQRQHSRILEPTERVDPYRYWGGRISELHRTLAELADLGEPKELEKRIRRVLADQGRDSVARRTVLAAVLPLAPRVGSALTGELLKQVPPLVQEPEKEDAQARAQRAALLASALLLAADAGDADLARGLLDAVPGLARDAGLIADCVSAVRKLELRREGAPLATKLAERLTEGKTLTDLRDAHGQRWPEMLPSLLALASLQVYLGQADKARPVLEEARKILFADAEKDRPSAKTFAQIAQAYAVGAGQGPAEEAGARLEELFKRVGPLTSTYTTNTHYSLYHLEVLEEAVLALTSGR
jgi:hypothetical protein